MIFPMRTLALAACLGLAAVAARAEGPRQLGCPDRFSVDKAVDAVARGRLSPELMRSSATLVDAAQDYYSCTAFSHDDESWCAPLAGVGRRAECDGEYQGLERSRAAIMNAPDGAGPGASADAQAFARAFQAKDAGQCGDSLVCRLFFGGGDRICERYYARARSLVCGAAASAPPVPPYDAGAIAVPKPPLEEALSLVAGAERSTELLEAWAGGVRARPKPADAAADCRENFSIQGLVHYLDGHPMPEPLAGSVDPIKLASLAYYGCAAFARRDPDLCAPHKEFDEIYPPKEFQGDSIVWRWSKVCRAHYNEMTMVHDFISGDRAFDKICAPTLAQTAEWEDEEFRDSDLPKVCRIIREFPGQPEAACARLGPLYLEKDDAKKCGIEIGRLAGQPSACEKIKTPLTRQRCFEYVSYKSALAAGDMEKCGDAPLCRVFMGADLGVCDAYAAPLRDTVCHAWPQAGTARERLEAQRLQIEADLEKAEAQRTLSRGADAERWLDLIQRIAKVRYRYKAVAAQLGD